MKRLCFIILCGLILYSCSKDETVTNYLESNKGNTSNYRTLAEALQIAQDAASMVNDSVETRAASRTRIVDTKNVRVITSPGTRSFSANNDTLLYVLNYEDEKGFAVVSANKATEGLLAVTEDGSYEESSDAYHDTGISDFMELAKSYATRGPEDSLIVDYITIDTIYEQVFPLVRVKWGKTNPEGIYCPNGICGCAATAIAQIMSYYNYPSSINLTYPNADVSNVSLDWTEMKKHKLYYLNNNGVEPLLYCTASDSAHHNIGRLCRQLGHLFNSSYDNNSTGTNPANILSPMISLGFTCDYWRSYTAGTARSSIQNNHPLYFIGYQNNPLIGHAWIVDGYRNMIITKTDAHGETRQTQTIYNHVNWGWNGRNNGYFLDNVFDISAYHSLDPSPYQPDSGHDFSYGVEYIIPYI